jgi:hypothetical protein
MKNPFEEFASESAGPSAATATEENPFMSMAKEAQASMPAKAKMIAVEHPKLGKLMFEADTSPDQIAKDINQRELESAKIEAAGPQLSLREQWESAQNPGDRLKMMADWVLSRRGAGMVTRAVISGAATRLPLVGRPIAGAASEIIGSAIEGSDTDAGKIVRSAIESVPAGTSQNLIRNVLSFAGAGAAGELAKEAINEEPISLKKVAENASQGGLNAVALRAADRGKYAQKEKLRQVGQDAVIIETLTQANERGLIVDPTLYGSTGTRSLMMKAGGGSTAFQRDASVANAPRMLEVLKEDIGARPDQALSQTTFTDLKFRAEEPYRQVAAISPVAKEAVDTWKQANADAAKAYRKAVTDNNPQAREAARTYSKQADDAFGIMEQQAAASGNPGLINDIKNARIQISKIWAVQNATNAGNGFPDAKVLGAMFEDSPGKFTGGLETIGRIAAAMPQVLQDPRKSSNMMRNVGFGAAGAGAAVAGSALGTPAMGAALGAGATVIPPLMRQAMMSRAAQSAMFLPQYGNTPDIPASILRFAAQQQNQPE